MAPEQGRGDGLRVGPASDVWALGVVLFECLTGAVPFPGDQPYEVVKKVVEDAPPCPRALAPGVPRDLGLVVLKCLEKDPHRRYPTALALADELGRFLAGEPVKVRPTGTAERCWRWARKQPTVAALTAAIVGLLFAVGVVVTVEGERAKTERDAAVRAERDKDAALTKAEAALTAAEEQLLRTEWLGYAGRVRTAAARWADGHPAEARKLLDGCPTEWRGWEYGYLDRLAGGGRPPFHRHAGPATVMALADGRLATAGDDTLRLWEADGTPGPVLAVGPHTAVAVTADGTRAAVGTDAGTVSVWDIPAGRLLHQAPAHKPDTAVAGLAFSPAPELLVSVGDDGHVILSADGVRKGGERKHSGGATCVAWRPDGQRFVTGGADGAVWLWDDAGRSIRPAPDPHPGGVTAVAFRPDRALGRLGQRLATAGPGRLVLREPGGAVVGRPIDLPDTPRGLAVGPDPTVYVGGSGGVVRGFSAEDGRPEPVALRHPLPVAGLAVRGDRVVTAGADGAVRAWHPRRPAHGRRFGDPDAPVRVAAFTPTGAVLTLTGAGRRVGLADPAGDAHWTLPTDDGPDAAALAPDWAVVGVSGGGTIRRHAEGRAVELLADAGSGTGLTLDRAGRFAARGADDGRLTVWELGPASARVAWEHTTDQPAAKLPVTKVRLDPAAGLALAAYADGTLAGYDLATGATRFAVTAGGSAQDVAVSPAGGTLAAAVGEAVVLWTLTPDGPVRRAARDAHTGPVTAVAFSPDGGRLASAGDDGTVRVWDAAAGDELLVLREPGSPVAAVEFDPAGRRLLSVTRDGVAWVWEAGPPDAGGDAARRSAATARLGRMPAAAGGADVARLRQAGR